MFSENRARSCSVPNGARALLFAVLCLAGGTARAQEVGLSVILVGTEAEASRLRDRLEAGEAFYTLARAHSRDATAVDGGYLGSVSLTDLRVEFQAALVGIDAGELVGPIRVDGGFALLWPGTPTESAWARARDAGLTAAGDGRHSDASGYFQTALEAAREFSRSDVRLGMSLSDLARLRRLEGDLDRAILLYREALAAWDAALGPDHADTVSTVNALADTYLGSGDYVRAAEAFDRSREIWERELGPDHPNVAASLNSLGLIRHVEGQYAAARALFDRALEIWEGALGPDHPNVASALANLAVAEMADSRLPEAERAFRRSLEIVERRFGAGHPEVARQLDGLAEVRGLQGDWSGAAALYRRSLALTFGVSPGTSMDVAGVLERFVEVLILPFVGGEPRAETVSRFEEAALRTPINERLYVAMSRILADEGHVAESESILAQAAVRFPDSRRLQYQRGVLAAGYGRFDEALDRWNDAMDLEGGEPSTPAILTRRGDLLVEAGRDSEARAAYELALDLGPNAAARVGLGTVYAHGERLDEALDEFREAARLDPDYASAYRRTSEVSFRAGRLAEAAIAAANVLELDPLDRSAWYIRGRALIELGREEEGRDALAEYRRLEETERRENRTVLAVSGIERDVRAALALGNAAEALRRLEAGIERYPAAYRLSMSLGLVQSRLGRNEAAIRTLESIVEARLGDDAVMRRVLSRAFGTLGRGIETQRNEALYLQRIRSELLEAASVQ